jgi:hypothetical protein
LAATLLGWLIYASSRQSLEHYLQDVQFDEGMAKLIAAFSISQVGWFAFFYILSAGLVTLMLAGAFAGQRAKIAGFLLGAVLVLDLGRANLPWLYPGRFWDVKEKYATNPVLDLLRKNAYEHRVTMLPTRDTGLLGQLYGLEWSQHLFLYENIQSLDVVQMARPPEDLVAYETALRPDGSPSSISRIARRWELTNTRYLLGPTAAVPELNQQLDPQKHRFQVTLAFDILGKPGVERPARLEELTAVTNAGGQYAVIEFTGALPRAKLYPAWEVSTNDQATLHRLADPAFDPHQTVLVSNPLPPPHTPGTNLPAGTVEYQSYAPARIVLRTGADFPSLLLLNDRFDPDWKVFVDGRSDTLLRCNFIMRGVALSAGPHIVEFRFEPSIKLMYVSLAAIGLGLLLLLALFIPGPKQDEPAEERPASNRRKN